MKVNILIENPVRTGEFADVKLSFEDVNDNVRVVPLKISFLSLKDFSNDTNSVAFDFFFISALIYGIDNLLERYQYSIDGWARDIKVSLPVKNLTIWKENEKDFASLLTFLTGDYWDIEFEQATEIPMFIDKSKRWKSKIPSYKLEEFTFASLFSGGLDSLVGVIDGITNLEDDNKALLLSHFDSSSPGANSDQERILNYFGRRNEFKNRYAWIQSIVALRNEDTHQNEIIKEASFRSRSLLFIGIALFCVESLPNCDTLTIPENGTISLNYPLTPSRTSTLSTRTTHPHYIIKLQEIISNIGLSTALLNPYEAKTKGEIIENCLNPGMLLQTYALSVSCGKRGRKMHWDTKEGTHHCGICMPCIYRRAALHKLNLDNQLYGIDMFTTQNPILNKYDFPALLDFLTSNLTTEQIKRTLLVAGSLPFNNINISTALVERVRLEIKQLIQDKGNNNFKTQAGI